MMGKPAAASRAATLATSPSTSTTPASRSRASGCFKNRGELGVEIFPEIAARQPEAQPFERSGGDFGGTAGNDTVEQRAVGDMTRHRSGGVTGVRERNDAGLRPAQGGGPHARDPAKRGRDADGAAGIRAEGGRREARCDRGGATTARAARDARGIVRVARRTKRRVVVGRTVGELLQ